MHILTESQCKKWCLASGIRLNEFKHPALPWREAEEQKIPSDAGRRVAQVTSTFQNFHGVSEILVWITDWSVWPSGERMHIFDRFRLSYGVTEPLIKRPGHIFKKAEYEDALSLTTLAVLFLWDCYVLSKRGRPALWYSHDEFGYFLQ